MVDGFYEIGFGSVNTQKLGNGIAILENGFIRGGDSSYYYVGEYEVKGKRLIVDVSSIHYAGPKNNILGNLKQYDMKLEGDINSDEIVLVGDDNNGNGSVGVILKRIADISREQAFDDLIEGAK